MRKTFGMNKHQKAVYKKGELQVSKEEVAELLEMSRSDDPEDRRVAAQYLCPCHVRTRIEPVWDALFRMLEDADAQVRRAAWHTLEDGGKPDDPRLDAILERTLRDETDKAVLRFANLFAGSRREKEMTTLWLAGKPPARQRGKCDFCGESDRFVDYALDTMIPSGGTTRAALICGQCARN